MMSDNEEKVSLGGGQGGVSSIQVIQKYSNFCVLQISRGTGPRAVEEWVAVREAMCFAPVNKNNHAHLHEKESSSSSCHKKPQSKPVLASPHYSAYAQSLVLIARRPHYLEHVHKVTLTIHCLVQGNVKQGTPLQWNGVMDGKKKCAIRGQALQVARSNTAGYISLVSVQNDDPPSHDSSSTTPTSSWIGTIAPRLFRKSLKDMGYPVLGNAKDARSFRGESLCMSVVRLEFHVSGGMEDDRHVSIHLPPAPRLRTLLEREERFWRKCNGKANNESHDNGVAIPPEYESGTATFDGLDFYITPSVMIPRKGTEALVERAMFLYNKVHGCDTKASILDFGTGSGCVLLSLLHRMSSRDAYGVGIDVSPDALTVAEKNATALGLHGSCYFWHGSFKEPNLPNSRRHTFNLIVCNPPYHTRGGRTILNAATVAHEPDSALYIDHEEDDYLIHYRHVLKNLPDLVTPKAVVVFEVFRDNAEGVARLMREAGLVDVKVGRDANGCLRTAAGIVPQKSFVLQEPCYSTNLLPA